RRRQGNRLLSFLNAHRGHRPWPPWSSCALGQTDHMSKPSGHFIGQQHFDPRGLRARIHWCSVSPPFNVATIQASLTSHGGHTMTRGRRCSAIMLLSLALVMAAVPAIAQPAGTLVVGLVAEPVNLDPPQVTDLNSLRVSRRIAETLVAFAED